ncbi:ankyrin repeat domain-containing protein [Rickettsiales endosymbiont of Peranema trichophorum]|uniref:ankyrin repeat domain-containing protein n=1 Tax=Rickettsiales endosymbiont of Peranema trichophorum TaxID=2486577 RepID=UPI0010232ABE|nr:ankyrin repeat domain-containing protein [Rickettsiales endosymbiont of Peranema trichophorum]RZI47381.1 ankyrin repeat domain-containing protein [Rickettsiales endosymbiont of Peranema trichophorum]
MPTIRDLWIYIDAGDTNRVRDYLNSGGDVVGEGGDYVGVFGGTPLHHAASMNRLRISQLLLAHPLINVDHQDGGRWTPLYVSVCHNHINVARLLLEHKANPNLVDINGRTSLHIAVDEAKYIDIVDLLLEVGAEPNVIDDEGLTPLSIAAAHQQKEICILLLQRGADINLCTEELRLSKVLSDTSQEAFEILEHNDKAILEMVAYSLALSRLRLPFEMIKEVCKYYESPYWCGKFDIEDIDELREVVLPTYAQKLLESVPEDVEMVDADVSSDEEESVACSNSDGIASQDLDGFSGGRSCSSDSNNVLANEPAVVIRSSERDCRPMPSPGNENQSTLLLNERLAWISTLPIWFQEHMMRLHIVGRLMEWLDSGPISIELTLSDRAGNFEAEHSDFSRYDAVPYTVEKASVTDYATEYHAELVGEWMMDSSFYSMTIDYNSAATDFLPHL